jgi:aromatic-L-amino-acid decarboxylase
VQLNQTFATLISTSENLSLVAAPSLALTVFRLEPKVTPPTRPSLSAEELLNVLNKLYYARISARDDILLTQTELNGVFCIRFVVGAIRTNESHVKLAYELLQSEAHLTIEAWEQMAIGGGN